MRHPGIEAYRRQQLEAMTPEQLVLVAFGQGVRACRAKDKPRAQRVVVELIGALDFDHEEEAGRLLSLYDWVLRLLGEDRFEEAGSLLDRLRTAWDEALERGVGAGPRPAAGTALPKDLAG
jgi:flagellin-specific chaperone FliS